jgi:hemerythrin-like domain-containing protein
MLSIVVYIQEYPEQAHHPLEDAIFSILLQRVSDEAKLIRELVTDHTEMEVITRNLRRSLELLKNGIGSKEKLKHQLSEFLFRQRRHLYIEEIKVYPLVKHVLTEQDWKDIQSMVPLMDDPVFGERTRSDYERLYREIEGKCK